MKREKEKKYFNHQYIPIIIGIVLFILLAGILVYFIINDSDINLGGNDKPNGDVEDLFEHDEMVVDTGSATCSSDTLDSYLKDANKIDIEYRLQKDEGKEEAIDYETGQGLGYNDYGTYIYMDISNVSNNLRFVLENDVDDEKIEVNGKNAKDGVLSVRKKLTIKKVEYVVSVYTNDKCATKPIRRFRITPPIYNYYADTVNCSKKHDGVLVGTKYCEQLIYGNEYSVIDIINAKIQIENGGKLDDDIKNTEVEKNIIKKTFNKIKESKVLSAVAIIVIILVAVAIVFIVRRVRKK